MVEVIEDTRRCRDVTRLLQKYDVIAMDAEGVNLGKDGPLTLLQIGTSDQKVYLFDVFKNKRLFNEGGIKDLLMSNDIVKVIHSCKGDSAALYFQFGVYLQNVFDTQVAHLVIEESKERKLPRSLKLADLCTKYSDSAVVSDDKDVIKEKFVREVGRFWEIRPLTKQMIDYASKDVTALIPDVYENQKSYIESNGLLKKYKERVKEEIDYDIDDRAREERSKRLDANRNAIISQLPEKYKRVTKLEDITDDDDLHALYVLNYEEDLDETVKRLKTMVIRARLDELDEQLKEEGSEFYPHFKSYAFLRAYQYHPDDSIKADARRILKEINTIALDNIVNKFDRTTCLEHLSPYEKDALSTLRPKGVGDRNIHPVHLHLHWLVKENDLDSTIERYRKEGQAYQITEGFYKWLKYCCSGNNPPSMKEKAKQHLSNLDKRFGKGKFVKK